MNRLAILTLAATLAAACAGQPSGEPIFGQAEAQAVRDRSGAFARAVDAGDIEQVGGFFHGDSVVLPAEQPTVRGFDAIKVFYQDFLGADQVTYETTTSDVGGHGAIAYETGSYTLTRTADDGASTRDRGKYVSVWRDRGGAWLIDYTIWTSDLAQPVQIAAANN